MFPAVSLLRVLRFFRVWNEAGEALDRAGSNLFRVNPFLYGPNAIRRSIEERRIESIDAFSLDSLFVQSGSGTSSLSSPSTESIEMEDRDLAGGRGGHFTSAVVRSAYKDYRRRPSLLKRRS